MPEALVPTEDAIERLLGSLERRLREAFHNKQRVTVHGRENMKRGSLTETDGSFDFILHIEPKK